ncbi:hypothetical protein P691DRAFT_755360 [Macrolepiota fuliginosa MF-IS2]|uniref:Uncharacterized protein n=1 Tax=Macrolepiota fuliginosa MF-IS2 TaxID=1400762 RepID=A0A9P5XND3_9AGAR|nr:hypothetical protein P691DRAFT_755360 [Macrolepiota fuliginosa MF-IS2]
MRERAARLVAFATGKGARHSASTIGGDARVGILSDCRNGDEPDEQPQRRVPFYRKPWFIFINIFLFLIGIALLFIFLYPVVRAIIQTIVNRTVIDVKSAAITSINTSNNSFQVSIQGNVTHTSAIKATIQFTRQVDVFWLKEPDTNTTGIWLGHLDAFDELFARDHHAVVDQTRTFFIEDVAAFTEFTLSALNTTSFSWRIHSTSLHVRAVKLPTARSVRFDKRVDVPGIDGLAGLVAALGSK